MRVAAKLLTGTAVAAVALPFSGGSAAYADEEVAEPAEFTSMFTVDATPGEVVGDDGEGLGEPGASGRFDLRINSDQEIICWDIVLDGVNPPFESPARTATHVHDAPAGEPGPPRLAFPDPQADDDGLLRSSGCMEGPFTTGVADDDGADTGDGFTLSEIEDDPSRFSADTHTSDFLDGAVRGQLNQVPHGGMDTGLGGGTAQQTPAQIGGVLAATTGAAALTVLAVGVFLSRRRAHH
ncbi:CHRD domain-containing protein [Natronosporangium hydrolyticum]|uniref:CHRD domain-containing protein n=1 Tax=Natronosporangium hydrolyticum TaxID=2811111 RepID=A0A895YGY4_9ACTN|nr:CHRD domain-containing protein [Natronosporangium hydrolyticum]QSB15352.1 CHRD domain-containing protein [Natronosporangium hydrolyticum]